MLQHLNSDKSRLPGRLSVMDQAVLIVTSGVIFLLAINSWLLWNGFRVLDDQVKLMRETLQLEIHALRDLMEETELRQKQRDK